MKVLNVIGARPQFIKAAVVSGALDAAGADNIVVHTGQHYDANMSNIFITELNIKQPDHNLGIGSAPHGAQTGRMLEALETVMLSEEPDRVLVYGDTNSTLAAALAASKQKIPLAHVEAGLRSYNRAMPEEINRVLTDHLGDMLFAPTEDAVSNLIREGISSEHIFQTGDVMYDAALLFVEQATKSDIKPENWSVEPGKFVLATVHRSENTDDLTRLSTIVDALVEVAESLPVVLPLHPRTRRALEESGLSGRLEALFVIDPIGYLEMLVLEKNAAVIATDSGGVQKEAFFFKRPCVTLRTETEWRETVDLGWNRIAPPKSAHFVVDSIMAAYADALPADSGYIPYGDGTAGKSIVELLMRA